MFIHNAKNTKFKVLRPSQKHMDCDIQVSIHEDNHRSREYTILPGVILAENLNFKSRVKLRNQSVYI